LEKALLECIHPDVIKDKRPLEKFRDMVFLSCGINHPNVVKSYEYISEGDFVAFTMEYVEGSSLDSLMVETVAIGKIVIILQEIVKGLTAIHDAGIVHRNIKPENILVSKENEVKIVDFCCAQSLTNQKKLNDSFVMGTIDYVTPEYMLSGLVDFRTDIYGVGVLAYELVTGELPFRGSSVYETMTMRVKAEPLAPRTLRKECPSELDLVILKCMAKDPAQRYQASQELLSALDDLSVSCLN
jgi:eukaryotic-like serine/threonine-protein kinase